MMARFFTAICLAFLAGNVHGQATALDGRAFESAYFVSQSGELVGLADFDGRPLIIDFWFTGCSSCSYFYKNKLLPLLAELDPEGKAAVISISTDRDPVQWQASIASGDFTSERAVNLYTGGRRFKHRFLADHGIRLYPSLIVRSADGASAIVHGANSFPLDELASLLAAYLRE